MAAHRGGLVAPRGPLARRGPGMRHRRSLQGARPPRLPCDRIRLQPRHARERPHRVAARRGRRHAAPAPRRLDRRGHVRVRSAQRRLARAALRRARACRAPRRALRAARRERARQPRDARRPRSVLQTRGADDRGAVVRCHGVLLPAEVDGLSPPAGRDDLDALERRLPRRGTPSAHRRASPSC